MKYINYKISFLLMLLLTLGACAKKVDHNAPYNEGIHITPKPQSIEVTSEGVWKVPSSIHIVAPGDSLRQVADFFASRWGAATGFGFDRIDASEKASNEIRLNLVGTDQVSNPEGYELTIAKGKGVDINASTVRGIFWGMQTLAQLFPAEIDSPDRVQMDVTLPYVSVKDAPRFGYRGMMVDCSRHFFEMDDLKKIIDVLSMVKINKFHWHLTDDQGWRIEVKKYPKLTEVGAQRKDLNGDTYGPYFYTQEDVKELVRYAAERQIDVVPEIEFPGHAQAALASYPELGCLGPDHDYQVRTIWGISDYVYCAGNDKVFQFMEDVLTEIIPLFPYEYIHIGGDECPKVSWKKCPLCQKRMRDNNLKNEEELQSYFIHRVEEVVLKNNRKMIGWEEILEGGLAPSATVLSWKGEESGIIAANMGHDIIMAPSQNGLYIDYYQGDSKVEPLAICCLSMLDQIYSYDPVPSAIAEDKRHHVIGAQANLWAEYVSTPEHQQYMAFPRVLALSEVGWTNPENKSFDDFMGRLDNLLVRLDYKDVNYHMPMAEQPGGSLNEIHFLGSHTVEFTTSYPVKILYTTDGSNVTESSEVYNGPITVSESTTLNVRTLLESTGKMSEQRTINLYKEDGYAPAEVVPNENGEYGKEYQPYLNYTFYEKKFNTVDELLNYTGAAKEKGAINSPESLVNMRVENKDYTPYEWGMIYDGYINIKEDGVYVFSTQADKLWIDGNVVVDNDGVMQKQVQTDVSLPLAKGLHPFKYVFFSKEFEGWSTAWSDKNVYIKKLGEDTFETVTIEDHFHKVGQ